ncbi:hypothetical protein RE6C_00117 [Rhodopirellula europaea 6C]|uniref:Uncharacterized protein n=1 Tax=Rhodopirellula europaea 6C TaxID=1263867 RepID=M2B2T1_9BACT|nr:hypothetical protein RE6C_00117 [Rhodopirellula europaea 6C]
MIDVVDEATSPNPKDSLPRPLRKIVLGGFAKRYSVGADSMASISPSNPL